MLENLLQQILVLGSNSSPGRKSPTWYSTVQLLPSAMSVHSVLHSLSLPAYNHQPLPCSLSASSLSSLQSLFVVIPLISKCLPQILHDQLVTIQVCVKVISGHLPIMTVLTSIVPLTSLRTATQASYLCWPTFLITSLLQKEYVSRSSPLH